MKSDDAVHPEEGRGPEQHNAALVCELEQRNTELRQAFDLLRDSHAQIRDLNRALESRVAQQARAFDAVVEDSKVLCNSLARDLRPPLRNIVCFAEVLEESVCKQLGGESLKLLAQIADAAREIDLLIEGLLEFVHTRPRNFACVELDLEEVLEEALEIVATEAASRQIEWRRSRLPRVVGDPALLREVLVKLLSNAIQYSRTRRPAIIEIGTRPGRTDEVVVFVRDNGVGFDLRYASSLFALFGRRQDSRERKGGLGIGLASARRIIARHGGVIWADAAVNRGATFFFSLPSPRAP